MANVHTANPHTSATSNPARSRSAYPPQQATQPPQQQQQHSTSHSTPKEAYYGHEYISKLTARFVTHLFTCPEYPPGSNPNSRHEQTRLPLFIAYALHRTKLHPAVTFAALVLLQRLKARFPTARGSSGHRLFISAYMIASKVICDDTYSNKSWSIVAQGMFNLREINQMEREMCNYLDWELVVDNQILSNFEMMIKRDFRGPGPYPTYSLKTVSRRAEKAEASPATEPGSSPAVVAPQPNMSSSPIPMFANGATNSPQKHDLAHPSPPLSAPRPTTRFPFPQPSEPHGYVPPPIPAGSAHTTYKRPSPAPITPDTPSPSHSQNTSPASSGPRTPQDHYFQKVHVAGTSPSMDLRRVAKLVPPAKSKMFAFATPATW